MKKGLLTYFIFVMAVLLAMTVAYVSISGLLTVFSGVGIVGLIFFSIIEVSKIVATSTIHTYGKKIGLLYNILLSLGIIIAMGITSMGVYGFLSSGYQKNASKLTNTEKQIKLIEGRIENKEKSRTFVISQLDKTQQSISQLRNALSNNTQTRVDGRGNVITTSSAGNRKAYEEQLKIAINNESELTKNLTEIDSTITTLSEEKLKIESESDVSNELGPLKYLAEVTGSSMDNVMKWFILLLIIIGDPLAILLIIIFNKIINDNNNEPKINNSKPLETFYESDIDDSEILKYYKDEEPIIVDENNVVYSKQSTVNQDEFQTVTEQGNESGNDGEVVVKKTIKLEDLPEKSNRGFSVNVPERKHKTNIARLS